MKLAWRVLGFFSCTIVVAAAACGGKVRGEPGATGGGDMGTSTGPSGTGTGTSSSGSTTTGIGSGSTTTGIGTGSTTTGAGGSIGIDPRGACEMVCARLIATGCFPDPMSCAEGCEEARRRAPACTAIFDEFVRCLQTAPLVCSPDGRLSAPECEPLSDKFDECARGPGDPPPPPPIDAGAGQCTGIVPPGPMACSGGGGGSATTTGGPGQPSCFTECRDANNNSWQSTCVGTTCSCTFNGRQYCSCTVAGPSCLQARSCCPGAP